MYVAVSEIEAFSLSKKFLASKIYPKYPNIFREIKDDSKYRYNSAIKDEIMKHKNLHVEVVNRKSTFSTLTLKQKEVEAISMQQMQVSQ